MQIYSFSPFGYEGSLVTVEVDLRRGIPAVDLVGLADGAVKEARERMHAAIRNSGFPFPPERVLISLSPADLRKEGAGFDLPIALGVLHAQQIQQIQNEDKSPATDSDPVLIMGELELSGKIRSVRGVHAAASTALSGGITKCIVPAANAEEAREVTGMAVFGANTLEEAFSALSNHELFIKNENCNGTPNNKIPDDCEEINGILFKKVTQELEFSQIKGQKKLIRGLQIAAAGGHNIIAIGAPGCGKTMSMQKFPGLLPLLTTEQAQPVTRILSIAGLLPPGKPAVRTPPFRMPHQTASIEGICGGGPNCRPGEISLAHNGVLFLDEAAEFKSSVLQMLRVPLENGRITISRAGRSTVFPADFQLLMAANPCPCGNYGSETKLCLCSAHSVELYWRKFSAPLLDRIDIRISVNDEKQEEAEYSASTAELRKEVAKAVMIQNKRQGKKNARLTPSEIAQFCKISEESQKILENAIERYGFSSRANASCLKLSRTIADMAGSQEILPEHLKEAIEMRKTYANLLESA